jgi:hypothetical protein
MVPPHAETQASEILVVAKCSLTGKVMFVVVGS